MRSLTLSASTLLLTIPECRITEIDPFVPVEFPAINYTVQGVATVRGLQHEPRYVWQLTALLLEDQTNVLRALFIHSDQRRRNFQHPPIILTDRIQRLVEPAPRTRGIAPGTTEELVGAGLISYFGQFGVFITNLKTPKQGRFYSCSFTLAEIEKIAA